MIDLSEKSIIVTGGVSGIGRAASVLFASLGAQVTIADINEALAEDVLDEIHRSGGTAQFIQTDISQPIQAERMVATAVSAYGGLDGAFNNAGRPDYGYVLHEVTDENFDAVVKVNIYGLFNCLKYELPALIKRGGGAIVNTSSASAAKALPLLGPYSATKAAVNALTKSAAYDYAKQGIRVNAIMPGTTRTPILQWTLDKDPAMEDYLIAQQLLPRLGEPIEIANAAAWLLSDASSFTTAAIVPIDGGYVA